MDEPMNESADTPLADLPHTVKEEQPSFYLSKIVKAHDVDVRDVVASPSGLVSSARDGKVKFWAERAGIYEEKFEIVQKSRHAVNSIAFYQSPEGRWLLFAGLKDGTIEVYDRAANEPIHVLQEHSANVCVLFVDSANKILMSGSWDARAVVWSISDILNGSEYIGRCHLPSHVLSVWAVSTVPSSPVKYLTGSADKIIKLHNHEYREIRSFKGHTDVVRAVLAVTPTVFFSTANDGSIRSWDLETGNCLRTYNTTHGEFTFSMCKLDLRTGMEFIITAGEKGYFDIWRLHNGQELMHEQELRVPAQTVWSVKASRNTDIVLATSTGNIFVYTVDDSKKADQDVCDIFDANFAVFVQQEMNAEKENQSDTVKIKVSLDDSNQQIDLAYRKGDDPTLTAEAFIKENNLPISYLNEITEFIKVNVPEARLAEAGKYHRQETQRSEIDGEKFDYSLEVRLEESGPVLQLGYNIGEHPDEAAQRFVEKHKLPIKFIPQLSTFLRAQIPELQTSEFVRIGGSSSHNYADPFTAGRYVPSNTPGSNTNGTGGDPLTGGSRYMPGSHSDTEHTLLPKSSMLHDKKRPRSELIPIREFFKFGLEGAASKTIPKLIEMNNDQPIESKLDDSQISAMNEIMTSNSYQIEQSHISALDISINWSINTIIPALDVFRVALLNEDLNAIFCSIKSIHEMPPKGNETIQRLNVLLISDPPDPVRILCCRALANAAVYESGRELLMTEISTVSKVVANQLSVIKDSVQVAAASALGNFARLLLLKTESDKITELGPREDVLRGIISVTEKVDSFSSFSSAALIRLLQTIATLMWGDSTVIGLAKNRGILSTVNKIKDCVTEDAAKAACRDITEMVLSI
ncbi:PFU (PLAA family ubiquitin binding) domain-containing protein [Ditylenchus destructor]|uniref:PFU (PLAA family ubiquitin binding) domain-containing protein n=1 Tax=Ditylenchus destructor TaxID=166010 RepID=A0AAD4RDE5_9BILA|nr:PFU (PLAA family ubiquitin binding) domain-containing protein [Ditylenchus destructor]